LSAGHEVITLTNTRNRENLFEGRVRALPIHFHDPAKLASALQGVSVLYNTYWVRFNYRSFTHEQAVANSKNLFAAARDAGVRRIVHVSITNPSLDSPLEYFRGKAELEETIQSSGIPHAILRPTVLFGKEDILINNIAWMLRRFPVYGVFGDGGYRLQPIYVDDLAQLAVEHGARADNVTVDAIGPETFTFRELVAAIGRRIGRERPIVSIPPWLGYLAGSALGVLLGDVVITRDEIRGLMDDLLYVESEAAGTTPLTTWVERHRDTLGARYTSELARRRR
jgi:NADH dehydrogenase